MPSAAAVVPSKNCRSASGTCNVGRRPERFPACDLGRRGFAIGEQLICLPGYQGAVHTTLESLRREFYRVVVLVKEPHIYLVRTIFVTLGLDTLDMFLKDFNRIGLSAYCIYASLIPVGVYDSKTIAF